MLLKIKKREIRESFVVDLIKKDYGYFLKTHHDEFEIKDKEEIKVIETYIRRREMINKFTGQKQSLFNY